MNRFLRYSTAVVASLFLLTTPGCKKTKKDSVLETSESISSGVSDGSETESFEIAKSEPTGFNDYIDETMPNHKLPSNFDIQGLRSSTVYFGGIGLGYGNPKLLKTVRDYFSDDTLNTEDIPFYSSPEASYKVEFFGVTDDIDLDYIRYVLEENNLRMWTDEIPTDYFIEKFPEYYDISNNDGMPDLDLDYAEYFLINGRPHGYDGSLLTIDYDNDKLELACFIQLVRYNKDRDAISANVSDNDTASKKYAYIETGVTEDGKWVWCPTEDQYELINNDTHKFPKCKNVDILVPETRQDLEDAHINVEKYDEMCEKVFGGAKMEKYKTQEHLS